jgi:hypothetical protein
MSRQGAWNLKEGRFEMKRTKFSFPASAALFSASVALVALIASAANAQSIEDQVIMELTEQGYSRIEVKTGPSQIKVEAILNDRELEVVYDKKTGAILKQEVNAVSSYDDTVPGIERRTRDRDFVRTSTSRDNYNDDNYNDDNYNDDNYDDDNYDDDNYGGDRADDRRDREDDLADDQEDREDDRRDRAEDRADDQEDREDDRRDRAEDRADDRRDRDDDRRERDNDRDDD